MFVRPACVLLIVVAFASACSDDDGGDDTSPTVESTSARATSTSVAPAETATPDLLASPDPDGERVLEHVRQLSVDIGPRVSGTQSEIVARDLLQDVLESYGYDVTIQEFAFDASAFKPVRVEIDGVPILGVALNGSGGGTVTGPLVAAGIGKPEEFPATGLNGAIALLERGDLTFREKYQNAAAAGAGGVLIYNNEAGNVIGDLDENAGVPVVGITQDAGEDLVERLATESIEVSIIIEELGTAFNVIAKAPGTTTCETVTGGHYDTVPATGGADDNASGTAAVLETARVIAARETPGAHCFVLFAAEEFGLFGSQYYVSQLSVEELATLRGMVNLDVVGLPQDLELIGSEDLVRQAGLIADGMGLPWRESFVPNGLGSDHASFLNANVPVVFLYRHDPLIHTIEDDITRMSADSLGQTVAVAAEMLAELGE